jgi:DNA polymerase-3 subunit alpha
MKAVERPAVTQFDKDDVEAIGLVKFDFLGLRTLTIIDWCVRGDQRAPRRCRRGRSTSTSLPSTTRTSYQLLARGETVAVFQLESPA